MFRSSINKISSDWSGFDLCVVDSSILKKPLFPLKHAQLISSKDSQFSYDFVLSFLHKNNYNRVDFLSLEGEFVLRGSIIDIFSFGEKKPIRINFYDTPFKYYLVDIDSGSILKQLNQVSVLPFFNKGDLSLFDLMDKNCLLVAYKDGFLSITNPLGGGADFFYKEPFISFDYQKFVSFNKDNVNFFNSVWLSSSGVFFNNIIVCPLWFVEDNQVSLPLSSPDPIKLIDGDYYIHSGFGVCCFLGFEEQVLSQDRLCFSFLDGVLKLDIKYLHLISYFSSASFGEKKLNSLNKTKSWQAKKNKVSSSAESYVKNIVSNYISRRSSLKSPCVYDEDVFGLFLSGFKYKDTLDQKKCWSEILTDLCSSKPMDRLLCGDVGFGKTEIALRASFISLYSNKSVVVLAPTTILSQQLFGCFCERLSPFGFECFFVSRLSKNSSKNINSFLRAGPSVLIGTHSILKNKNSLKKAGLFIVDEEHRFGVKDKEFVFSLNSSVDYLSMSATPIPRSLQFSLSSVRDISTMLTPPLSRKPIITYILKYSFSHLKNVVFNELSRFGQVFIVDNSVKNVLFLYNKLSVEFEGVVVSCLFGSQKKTLIKKTMDDFRVGKINVLISTTIIESGIDVPKANTLIVLNSHLFGLSQLYQLRGRVGRSTSQAYSFLFIPDKKSVTPQGLKRLSSLQKNTALGSGYDIALSDLDIRGPGSLFGYSQSGTSLVGFEFYTKLLNQAVFLLYPEDSSIQLEKIPIVSLGSDFIPKNYISFDVERVSVYSFLSSCICLDQLALFYRDCILKYGPPPLPFDNLFKSRELSLYLYNKDFSSVSFSSGVVSFSLSSFCVLTFDSLVLLLDSFFKPKKISYVFKNMGSGFKFQFNYNKKDVYILVELLIKVLYE